MIDPNILYTFAALLALIAWFRPDQLAFAPAGGLGDEEQPDEPEEKPWEKFLMFKKGGSSSPPPPDPRIGEAAEANVQLGREWKDFAERQFETANRRQADMDQLTEKVVNRQLESQDQASQWATEDRQSSMADREWALERRDRSQELADQEREWASGQREWATDARKSLMEDAQSAFRQAKRQSAQLSGWAQESRRAGRQDRDWAMDQRDRLTDQADDIYARSDEIQGVADEYRDYARDDREFAEQMRGDYEQFRPVNERIVDDAMEWDSDARQETEAGRARADVMRGADLSRQQTERQMASMGINPNSGRFNATNRSNNLNTALAATGAQDNARRRNRQEAVGMRSNAAQLGQNVLGQSQQATNVAGNTASLANNTEALATQNRNLGMNADAMSQQAAQYGTNAIQGAGTQESSLAADISNTGASMMNQATGLGLNLSQYGSSLENAGARYDNRAMQDASFAAGQYNAPLGAAGVGLNAGNAATGNAQANQASWANNANIMGQGFQGNIGTNQGAAGSLNTLYGNQLNAWGMGQSADAANMGGLMGGVGTIVGAGINNGWFGSSEKIKTKKKPVRNQVTLEAIKGIPVEAWEYKDGAERMVKGEIMPTDKRRHVGPYAEDWARVTGLGDGERINMQDAFGVTLKAVQDLAGEVDELKKSKEVA